MPVMKCFCGCGRRVSVFERTANSYGKTAKLLVGRLEDMDEENDPDFRALLEGGRKWFDQYAAATHSEIPLKSLSTTDWKAWRNIAYRVVKEFDARQDRIGKWVLKEGLTPEAAARKVAATTPEEQQAWRARLGLPT